MKEDTRPLMVSIRCITYNHEPYIRQCLEGIVIQKTDFRFEAVVHDDASTDGTAAIVREYAEKYPDIIKPILETENQFSKHDGSLDRIMEDNCRGKYIALCEGDDYWTDPLKLQKQVDFLETHPEYGMVYTAYRQQNDVTGKIHDVLTSPDIKHDGSFKWKLLEQKVMVGTCTAMIEAQLLKKIRSIKDDFQGYMMGDTQIWFNAARLSRVGYIPDVTGVYRKQPTGATSNFNAERRSIFLRNCLDMFMHLANKYGAPKNTRDSILKTYSNTLIRFYINNNDYASALQVNKQLLNNSTLVRLVIKGARLFKLHNLFGFGTILRICVSL